VSEPTTLFRVGRGDRGKRLDQFLKQRIASFRPIRPGTHERLKDGVQVLLHRQLSEDTGFLGQVADPEAGSSVHGETGNLIPFQQDTA